MGTSKFNLAVGLIALMAAPLAFTEGHNTTEVTNKRQDNTESATTSTLNNQDSTPQASSKQSTTNSAIDNSANTSVIPSVSPKHPFDFTFLDAKVALMGGGAVLFGLLISNIVLACCICSLRRRVSYWTINRIGNLTDVTEDRYVVRDAGLPADQAVELSTIYTMPDKTEQERNTEEAHNAEGTATTSEVEPANGDAQSPEQAEILPPEPPTDVAEPADDVTHALLVV